MSRPNTLIFLVNILLFSFSQPLWADGNNDDEPLHWIQTWSDELFERAQKEHKFILLDLEAIWCHWCHVMEETTYKDPAVMQLLKQEYITVRVDQDTNPDLLARYGDYGWPALQTSPIITVEEIR